MFKKYTVHNILDLNVHINYTFTQVEKGAIFYFALDIIKIRHIHNAVILNYQVL